MFSLCSVYIHSTFILYSVCVQSVFSLYSVYIQSIFSLCSVYVQSMFSVIVSLYLRRPLWAFIFFSDIRSPSAVHPPPHHHPCRLWVAHQTTVQHTRRIRRPHGRRRPGLEFPRGGERLLRPGARELHVRCVPPSAVPTDDHTGPLAAGVREAHVDDCAHADYQRRAEPCQR